MTLGQLVNDHWHLIARDLLDIGIDVWDRELLRARPFTWLREAILGLLDRPGAIDMSGAVVAPNRVQELLTTPVVAQQRATQ